MLPIKKKHQVKADASAIQRCHSGQGCKSTAPNGGQTQPPKLPNSRSLLMKARPAVDGSSIIGHGSSIFVCNIHRKMAGRRRRGPASFRSFAEARLNHSPIPPAAAISQKQKQRHRQKPKPNRIQIEWVPRSLSISRFLLPDVGQN